MEADMNKSQLFRAMAGVLCACAALTATPSHADDKIGAWQPWNKLPFFPVHVHTLPTGAVMIWPGDGGINGDAARLLDPATQNLSPVPAAGYDLFCSGHSFLTDGSLLVAGGHIQNNVGLARASRYVPASNSWQPVPKMNAGRWYPTVTTLANGDALVVSGDIDLTKGVNQVPQVYQRGSNSWRTLSTATRSQPLYPMMFLAPNGRVVSMGPDEYTASLDTSGTGSWAQITRRNTPFRLYGSAVMYADGKVLLAGGGDPPVASAEVIDLNQQSPSWRPVGSMSFARQQMNATVLPDGKVLITGGTSGAGFNNPNTPVLRAEMWDPATETFSLMASGMYPRIYHSAATLLPDGRVLVTGGNNQLTPEVYSPPYLFKGPRPVISSAPAAVGYGRQVPVQTTATDIAKVTLIRLGSVTHAFDENQRLNVLPFTPASGAVDVTTPANSNIAPPGHYLLFLVNALGVPSEGRIVQLTADAPNTPPPPTTTTYQVSVSKVGTEASRGVVTSIPAGINCGTTCSANFAAGSVELTARVNGNVVFGGWSGACSGTGTCRLILSSTTGNQAVTANFVRRR
jgi:hypothetical protein